MKKLTQIITIALLLTSSIFTSCKKEPLPNVTQTTNTTINAHTYTLTLNSDSPVDYLYQVDTKGDSINIQINGGQDTKLVVNILPNQTFKLINRQGTGGGGNLMVTVNNGAIITYPTGSTFIQNY